MDAKAWANVVLCVIIFLLIGYAVHRVSQEPDVISLLAPDVTPSRQVVELADQVVLERYHFDINQVNHQVRAEFWVSNGSDFPVRDVAVHCDLRDKQGQRHGSNRWVLYRSLPASHEPQSQVVEDVRYISHAVAPEQIVCRIVDFTLPAVAAVRPHQSGH